MDRELVEVRKRLDELSAGVRAAPAKVRLAVLIDSPAERRPCKTDIDDDFVGQPESS